MKYAPSYMNNISNNASETVKELRIISDSCPGQNKNTVVRLLEMFAANGSSTAIFQHFPPRGPCDRNFGLTVRVLHELKGVHTPE
jgi:hypothetical protein